MKINKWTLGLAAAGLVSLGSVAQAEENQVMTALSSTSISGYVSTSAIWNLDSGNNMLAGRTYVSGPEGANNKMDGFNLDVVKLEVAKPIDEGSWSAGYKFGVYLGPDSDAFVSGFADNVGLSEAYIDLRAPVGNGLDIRAGYFPTIIGFEVYDSPSNPNFSRSYGYAMEPFNHTGILLSYQINDIIGVSVGVANDGAQSNVIGFRDGHDSTLSYMAAVSLMAPEGTGFLEGSTLTAGIIDTGIDGGPGTGNPDDIINYYIGGTLPTPVEGLSLGVAFDFAADALAGATPATFGQTEDQWALAGYVSYMASDKLTLSGRVDYAKTDSGFGGVLGSGGQSGSTPGENEDLLSFTLTADYKLWDNVLSRLEFRYDMADEDVFGGAEGAGVFGTGDSDDAATIAANLVYQF